MAGSSPHFLALSWERLECGAETQLREESKTVKHHSRVILRGVLEVAGAWRLVSAVYVCRSNRKHHWYRGPVSHSLFSLFNKHNPPTYHVPDPVLRTGDPRMSET